MPRSRKQVFNVWLAASGKEGADLEEALRMNSLGHFLQRFADEASFFWALQEMDRDVPSFPNLFMYLMSSPDAPVENFFRRLKTMADCRHIPVIVFHAAGISPNVKRLYALGAASVIRVPIRFDGLVEVMRTIEDYWFNVAAAPPTDGVLTACRISDLKGA